MLASEVPFRSLEQPEHPISSSKIIAPNLDTYIQLGTNICHVTSPPSIPFCVPLVRATLFSFGRIGVSSLSIFYSGITTPRDSPPGSIAASSSSTSRRLTKAVTTYHRPNKPRYTRLPLPFCPYLFECAFLAILRMCRRDCPKAIRHCHWETLPPPSISHRCST